ncbi:hypothetical protein LJC60_03590 [Ruminococcaceae bacterium OttesenSCG-928-D13]|nr:hypothetical protein [Ruminococcaceae bacterium OttesenSCG-928-D13]
MMKKTLKTRMKNRKALVALVSYGLFLLGWLGLALAGFIMGRVWPPRELDPAAATPVNLARLEDGGYLSEGVDPQLIFEGVDEKVRVLRLEAGFEHDPGELELFYTRREGQGFSPRQRVIGAPQDDGSVLFILPPGNVRALRLDPGTAGESHITIGAVTLNPRLPAAYYFVPTLGELLAFALLPALAVCLIYNIIELIDWAKNFMAKRRNKNAAAGNEA